MDSEMLCSPCYAHCQFRSFVALASLPVSNRPIYQYTAVIVPAVYLTFVYHYARSILITEFSHSNDLHFGLFQTM